MVINALLKTRLPYITRTCHDNGSPVDTSKQRPDNADVRYLSGSQLCVYLSGELSTVCFRRVRSHPTWIRRKMPVTSSRHSADYRIYKKGRSAETYVIWTTWFIRHIRWLQRRPFRGLVVVSKTRHRNRRYPLRVDWNQISADFPVVLSWTNGTNAHGYEMVRRIANYYRTNIYRDIYMYICYYNIAD